MKPKVYLETSVISYLASRPSRDLIVAANQQLTQEWWQVRRRDFDLFISQLVVQEAAAGDADASQQRLQAIADIPLLKLSEEAVAFAERLVKESPIPQQAVEDALHIAVATGLLAHLEFQTHCECNNALQNRTCLPPSGL